jgi:hypothetical protein
LAGKTTPYYVCAFIVTLNMNGAGQDLGWEVIGIYQTAFNDNFGSIPIFAPLDLVVPARSATRISVRENLAYV